MTMQIAHTTIHDAPLSSVASAAASRCRRTAPHSTAASPATTARRFLPSDPQRSDRRKQRHALAVRCRSASDTRASEAHGSPPEALLEATEAFTPSTQPCNSPIPRSLPEVPLNGASRHSSDVETAASDLRGKFSTAENSTAAGLQQWGSPRDLWPASGWAARQRQRETFPRNFETHISSRCDSSPGGKPVEPWPTFDNAWHASIWAANQRAEHPFPRGFRSCQDAESASKQDTLADETSGIESDTDRTPVSDATAVVEGAVDQAGSPGSGMEVDTGQGGDSGTKSGEPEAFVGRSIGDSENGTVLPTVSEGSGSDGSRGNRAGKDSSSSLKDAEKQLGARDALISVLREELKQLQGEIEQNTSLYENLKQLKSEATAATRLREELKSTAGDLADLQKSVRRLEDALAEMTVQKSRAESNAGNKGDSDLRTIRDLEAKLQSERVELQRVRAELKARDSSLLAAQSQLANLKEQMKGSDAVNAENTVLRGKLRISEVKIEELQSEIRQLQADGKWASEVEEELRSLKASVLRSDRLTSDAGELANLHARIDSLKLQLASKDSEISRLRGESMDLDDWAKLRAAQKEVERLKGSQDEVARLVRELQEQKETSQNSLKLQQQKDDEIKALQQTICDLKNESISLGSMREDMKQLGVRDSLISELRAQLRYLQTRDADMVALQRRLKQQETELFTLRENLWLRDFNASSAEQKAEQAQKELRCAKLAAMVDKLGSTIRRELTFVSDIGSGAFADLALVRTQSGHEVVAKFSCTEESRDLLLRESQNLEYLNALSGADRHIVKLLHPYCHFDLRFGSSWERFDVGAVILEKAKCDLSSYAEKRVGTSKRGPSSTERRSVPPLREEPARITPAALKEVMAAFAAWERSILWLHDHGVLHLDIKPENAIFFPDQNGAVKLIDVGGMVTRKHVRDPSPYLSNKDLVWDGAYLQKLGLPYVATEEYAQPSELGRGPRFLDFTADWWSVGVSKLELLAVQPSLFDDESATSGLVLEALKSGDLQAAIASRISKLLGTKPSATEEWIDFITVNLDGKPYLKQPPLQ